MINETKRDVFEKALREWDDLVHRTIALKVVTLRNKK